MTCDPIGGLVQIPCIERNAFGAVKAIAAASLALHGDGSHKVSLDSVIATMRQALDEIHRQPPERSLLVLRLHVGAGLDGGRGRPFDSPTTGKQQRIAPESAGWSRIHVQKT